MTDVTRDTRGRFPPGQSGNRNGRPKKPKTVSDAIIAAMNKTVAANENGRKMIETIVAKKSATPAASSAPH